MLDMINSLQSERIDSQRAELRPVQRGPSNEPAPGTSLPGLRSQHTTRTKPEDDFLEMIARVQVCTPVSSPQMLIAFKLKNSSHNNKIVRFTGLKAGRPAHRTPKGFCWAAKAEASAATAAAATAAAATAAAATAAAAGGARRAATDACAHRGPGRSPACRPAATLSRHRAWRRILLVPHALPRNAHGGPESLCKYNSHLILNSIMWPSWN